MPINAVKKLWGPLRSGEGVGYDGLTFDRSRWS
jgi:hypothetical protein